MKPGQDLNRVAERKLGFDGNFKRLIGQNQRQG
jgi:hypothetical protein